MQGGAPETFQRVRSGGRYFGPRFPVLLPTMNTMWRGAAACLHHRSHSCLRFAKLARSGSREAPSSCPKAGARYFSMTILWLSVKFSAFMR